MKRDVKLILQNRIEVLAKKFQHPNEYTRLQNLKDAHARARCEYALKRVGKLKAAEILLIKGGTININYERIDALRGEYDRLHPAPEPPPEIKHVRVYFPALTTGCDTFCVYVEQGMVAQFTEISRALDSEVLKASKDANFVALLAKFEAAL